MSGGGARQVVDCAADAVAGAVQENTLIFWGNFEKGAGFLGGAIFDVAQDDHSLLPGRQGLDNFLDVRPELPPADFAFGVEFVP